LNFGDMFAYDAAQSLGAPLLFVGEDFAATDVAPALAPEGDAR
ncbi:MAG: VapC toxin family PIN domain ribonuclease, partial [Rhodobacteraceae bacterium]